MKLFSLLLLIFIPALSSAKHKICLSDHIFKEFKSYGQSLENAVELALKDTEVNIQVEKYYFDKSPLASIDEYKKMKQKDCSGVVGFSYLTDLLTLSNTIENIDIPIFSPYGSKSYIELQENIKLLQPRQDQIAEKIVEFINKKFSEKQVTVITDLRRVTMTEYKKALVLLFGKKNINYIDIVKDEINLKKTKKMGKVVIALTGTSVAVDLIQNAHESVTFIGVETFGSKTSPSLMKLLGDSNKKKIFAFRNISFDSRNQRLDDFYKSYEQSYGTLPSMLSVYGYDSTKILIKILNGDKSEYIGLSGVKYKNGKVFNSNKYVLIAPSDNYSLLETGSLNE